MWTALGLDPATTLHDVRYGEHYKGGDVDAFVWVFEISGSAPPSHFVDGYDLGLSVLTTIDGRELLLRGNLPCTSHWGEEP